MAAAALVKAREWVTWWRSNYARRIGDRAGWERFLVDSAALLQESCVRDARRHRGHNALRTDHRGFSADELHDPVETAERDLAWFLEHVGAIERDAPTWARFLFTVMEGVLRNRVRLAQEHRQILRKGYLTVNVNPHATRRDDLTGEEEQ